MNKRLRVQFVWMGLALVTIACGNKNQQSTEIPRGEFPVTVVHQADIETDLVYVADIQAVQNVEIRARVNGYLEKIFIDEGKPVVKGQLLFQINDEEYLAALYHAEANLKSAEAELKSAQVETERVRLLVEKDVITKTEMDLALAKMEIAKSKIEEAKADKIAASIKLANTKIRSPFTGVIDRIPFKLGSLISEGTLLTSVSDISSVFAYFKISEVEYLRYINTSEQMRNSLDAKHVQLILADGTSYPDHGVVETMEAEFEEGTGTLAVRARFPNTKSILKHGSNGKIKVHRSVPKALLVPQKSVMEIQDRNYVYVLTPQQTVMMKSFDILQRYGDYYLVSKGLVAGEKIIYEGVQNLKEGSVIKPIPVQINQVYNNLKRK